MKNSVFYDYIDNELQAIINSEVYSGFFDNLKQEQQKKSFSFLIWFLNSYASISNVEQYITDGHDDSSCDIILDKVDSQGEKSFYIVQSKWNAVSNCDSDFDSKELKSFLSDIHAILKGEKQKGANERFNAQYDALREHIRKNGRVKIIYLCLKNNCKDADDNIKALKNSIGGNIEVEGFDIHRLKIDYISREYKKSFPPNPLENVYNPELDNISVSILRSEGSNSIEVHSPFNAYVFLVRPRLIYDLVNKYGVSLFERNVRNPLMSSTINEEIKNTLLKNPSYFWYYNNGVTGITRRMPKINSQAEEFDILGLQIINGAQTAYSIYRAYKECSQEERMILDEEAKITFRLLKSGGSDFDLKVTKYTNSQNPVSERDFWSNDPIQKKLQDYFFNTQVWYEKRDGEFREEPDDVYVIPNRIFASAYMGFWLLKPVDVVKSALAYSDNESDRIFSSRTESAEGLYETIFNSQTDPKIVHASFILFDILTDVRPFAKRRDSLIFTNIFHVLSIIRIVSEKYVREKYDSKANLISFILKHSDDDKNEILKRLVAYSLDLLLEAVESKPEKERGDYIFSMMSKQAYIDMFLEDVRSKDITVEMIENQDLEIFLKEDEDEDEDEDEEVKD